MKIHRIVLFLAIVAVSLGVFFRVTHLEQKVYWVDEAWTSLWLSGHSPGEVVESLSDRVFSANDLQPYQQVSPERPLTDTVQLIQEYDVHLPPAYFILTRLWTDSFGSDIRNTRFPAAVMGVLAIPLVYWLSWELFGFALAGWIGMAIIASSPFHLLYAQEARFYSLWTVTILLSSAVLLRATRLKRISSWGWYALTVSFSLYTSLLNILVIFSHGLYVLISHNFRFRDRALLSYLGAASLGFLTFIPWLLHIHDLEAVGHVKDRVSMLVLGKLWILNLARFFIDVKLSFDSPLTYLILPVLGLVIYSIYFACTQKSKKVLLFLGIMIGITVAPFLLPDLMWGGRRSIAPKYLIPSYLSIQLAVVYLFSTKFIKLRKYRQWFLAYVVAFAILISLGLFSCYEISRANYWWNKHDAEDYRPIAEIINSASNPSLIFYCQAEGFHVAKLLAYSYVLSPKVRIQIATEVDLPDFAQGTENLFLIDSPEDDLRTALEDNRSHQFKLVYKGRYGKLYQDLASS